MSIKSTVDFNSHWGDTESNKRIASSEKGQGFHEAEIENALKDMALRFERSPGQSTIKLWASDLANLGYKCDLVGQVCKSIPYKMDKHPTLNEIMALIKPYLAQETFSVDELTDLSNRCYPHLKAKFLAIGDQGALTRMTKSYAIHVFPFCEHFTETHKEMLVLNDWLRGYFKTHPQAILDQGRLSNEAFERKDLEYFVNPLKRYAKENKL
jgi:hypothetical protein